MMGYADAYNLQWDRPPWGQRLGMPGYGPGQATPFGMPMPPTLTHAQGTAPAPGGGWAGALGRATGWLGDFTGWNDMEGAERAFALASVGGGIYDAIQDGKDREEEKRRYEEQMRESRRHREMMGANLNRAWGG